MSDVKERMVGQPWDELYVDIENNHSRAVFDRNFARLQDHFMQRNGRPISARELEVGPGRARIIVKLPRPTKSVLERIFLEAILGGEPSSCMLTWIYIETGKSEIVSLDAPSPEEAIPFPTGDEVAEALPFTTEDDLPFK